MSAAKPVVAKPVAKKQDAPHPPAKTGIGRIAVIRIRGKPGMGTDMLRTLSMLRLHRTHYCAVFEDTPSIRGMIDKVKGYVTYGDIDDETFSALVAKRGEPMVSRQSDRSGTISYSFLEVGGKKYNPVFRLAPPRKGFERKGIKLPFTQGGALGNRAEKINDLIKRMM